METWTRTGNLTVSRSLHAATALPTGQVLVVGGYELSSEGVTSWRTAELYDPSSRTWTPTGSMFYERSGHTATLLANGRVLVAGGTSNTNTELYYPDRGEWYATGRLTSPRPTGHAAARLSDGRVLVVGGFDQSIPFPYCFLSSSEIYDPETQVWTKTADMARRRYLMTVTALSDGRALVVGGGNGLTGLEDSAEVYDPSSDSWSSTGLLYRARFGHSASRLPDGSVLVAGGLFNATTPEPHYESLADCERYDPERGNWYSVGKLQEARRYHTASVLHDGRVLVVGGVEHDLYSGGYVNLQSTEVYHPSTFVWTSAASLNVGRSGHTETVLSRHQPVPVPSPLQQGSTIIVAGGGSEPNSSEMYSFEPPVPVNRS